MSASPEIKGLLTIPHLRVQNANAISSPLTWGFPAISAFIGLMHALQRKLPCEGIDLQFAAIGVISHWHEAQASGDYTQGFHLSRNPVDKDGDTAAIVEEGRIHLDITLILGTNGTALYDEEGDRIKHAESIVDLLQGMRVAGGTIIPTTRQWQPSLYTLNQDDAELRAKQFRTLRRYWLPGAALVARDDLLHSHLVTLQKKQADATLLDAWLDKSRLNRWPEKRPGRIGPDGEETETVQWRSSREEGSGWIVPIPVGYGALSPLYQAGQVAHARDNETPLRFVESVYSLGEWISPHRLTDVCDLLWYPHYDDSTGLYRCQNDYVAPTHTENPSQE